MFSRPICLRILLFASALLWTGLASAADVPAQASGKFAGAKISFNVGGGYAFWSRGSERFIEVAISNDPFLAKSFDAFYDPKPVIGSRFADNETFVVYFEFEPTGRYHGLSYYFGSGDGCGFCYDSSVKSTVRIENQRLKGRLFYREKSPTFDVELDVPIAPEEWGKPISGDGGEIGAAFRAYNAAWDKGDRKAVFEHLDSANQARWKKKEKEGKLDEYVAFREKDLHWNLKNARIVGGYSRGDQAVLLVKAKNSYIEHIHGQVSMMKESSGWKIFDEVYEVGE